MKIAIAIILLVVFSVAFHLVSPWYLPPIASNWQAIDDTISLTFWVTGIVFILVNFFLAYVVIKYRKGKQERADYEPENKRLEIILTTITTIGVAAMLAPGLLVWDQIIAAPEDSKEIEVVGQQWQWSFRFPGDDNKFGKVNNQFITVANPFGINPSDPAGQDDLLVSGNEVHMPLEQPIKVLLRSKDVLHNFTVTQFRVKMDLVPGTVTSIWFKPTRLGSFEILCEELCGIGHFAMRGRVVVDTPEDYQTWLNQQPTFAQTQDFTAGDPLKGQSAYMICATCHGQKGEGNAAMNAPKIAGMAPWYVERQLRYYQQGIRGKHKDDMFGQQMAPMALTLSGATSVDDVAAYIKTLQDIPVVETIQGDTKRGMSLYRTCGTCHGATGLGNQGLNAPRLANQHDWYLKRQLENFKQGIRGKHPHDVYGVQMRLMSRTLRDEQSIMDIISYINTL
ncbi:MAG: cytochrome c oxidase subunit II [Kangiellaceae bacterium]|nr:cytochrome c oxidase subunit II [Kangiellaceae bacterium]